MTAFGSSNFGLRSGRRCPETQDCGLPRRTAARPKNLIWCFRAGRWSATSRRSTGEICCPPLLSLPRPLAPSPPRPLAPCFSPSPLLHSPLSALCSPLLALRSSLSAAAACLMGESNVRLVSRLFCPRPPSSFSLSVPPSAAAAAAALAAAAPAAPPTPAPAPAAAAAARCPSILSICSMSRRCVSQVVHIQQAAPTTAGGRAAGDYRRRCDRVDHLLDAFTSDGAMLLQAVTPEQAHSRCYVRVVKGMLEHTRPVGPEVSTRPLP